MADNMDTNKGPSTKDKNKIQICNKHRELERNLRAFTPRKFYKETLDLETKDTINRDETTILKRQKDLADINELMELCSLLAPTPIATLLIEFPI
ncbi:hypothetical protein TNCT_645771 [Trichonephila clavata]|uniref:Uncharacterized protein n=1 Tax=Trichonephila clavata TaxID=2740835 RepID=A0A8X6J7E9_TRICU|nr:hypothetical protein TNCT_645771 [Trichonephila clavata]